MQVSIPAGSTQGKKRKHEQPKRETNKTYKENYSKDFIFLPFFFFLTKTPSLPHVFWKATC